MWAKSIYNRVHDELSHLMRWWWWWWWDRISKCMNILSNLIVAFVCHHVVSPEAWAHKQISIETSLGHVMKIQLSGIDCLIRATVIRKALQSALVVVKCQYCAHLSGFRNGSYMQITSKLCVASNCWNSWQCARIPYPVVCVMLYVNNVTHLFATQREEENTAKYKMTKSRKQTDYRKSRLIIHWRRGLPIVLHLSTQLLALVRFVQVADLSHLQAERSSRLCFEQRRWRMWLCF